MSVTAVYDTMLFFQAATQPHRPRTTMQAIHDGRVKLFLSMDLITEMSDVFSRPEYQVRFPALHPEMVTAFIADVLSHGTMLDRVPNIFTWPQHPNDDHLFNLAIHAKAKYLVTWETRILKLAIDMTPAADLLRQLAPDLAIVTPKQLSDAI